MLKWNSSYLAGEIMEEEGIQIHLQHWVTALAAVRSLYSRYMLCVPEREL